MRRGILRPLLGALLLLLAVSPACDGDPAEEAVEQSFRSLIEAIETHDADAVWSLTTQPFRSFCDELHRELADAGRLVRLYFPEWEHERLLGSLAWHRLGDATDGRSLFARLLDFEQVRSGDAVRAGLEHDSVLVQGNRATIMTKAREKFTFLREEDGVWRTDIYERARGFPLVETLQENMATLRSNVEHLRGLYRTGTDPKTPEGAFNQFRQALDSADGAVLERLLDEPAREAVAKLHRALVEIAKARSGNGRQRLAAADLDKLDLAEATRSPPRSAPPARTPLRPLPSARRDAGQHRPSRPGGQPGRSVRHHHRRRRIPHAPRERRPLAPR